MNRSLIGGVCTAIALLLGAAGTAGAAPPQPAATTPELLAQAKDEKKIVWYTSIELQTAEKIAKEFEGAHPGIDVQVERNGCERIVQRIAQERSSNIHAADVVECSGRVPPGECSRRKSRAECSRMQLEGRMPAGMITVATSRASEAGSRPNSILDVHLAAPGRV